MTVTTPGLHHVTAIAGDPERNASFYVETLGLRFVKRTVNHDDTKTYHFYFGDGEGTPGTNFTFFPWTDRGRRGEFGAGQAQATAYLIEPDSLEYWVDRLESRGVDVEQSQRFGEAVLAFEDPDGIGLELVASEAAAAADAEPWDDSPIPADHQLRGFHSVTLAVPEFAPTASVLTNVLGYELDGESDGRRRYRAAGENPGSVIDLVETDLERGRMGIGTVHHVAFTVTDVEAQERWRDAFSDHGQHVTEVIDRKYFQSIYSREPGGVLFEMATTKPGFTVDESIDELGSRLTLPEWLENERAEIEAHLPPFDHESIGSGEH
ncbi:ring-cleaving dioxygenase [Haloarcula litorea]|uniref:ring-cleaving dioxygenase n=1 Tax=Haloarcula litorea TaxID=3032579 RepID=UPI0023E77628|nr:ring-cleaving dioxygenase [Halomicroarcula sp. GDY20]